MKSIKKSKLPVPFELDKFQIKQAIVPLTMGTIDDSVLKYFRFFTEKIPAQAAYFFHVVKYSDLLEIWGEEDASNFVSQFLPDENIIKDIDRKVKTSLQNQLIDSIDYDVKEGDPAKEIMTAIEKLKSDLLVLGKRKKLESSSKFVRKVTRVCKSNVMIVPESSKTQLKKILVPVDFSNNSGKALELAMEIKNQMNEPVEVEVVYIYTLPSNISFTKNASWDLFQLMVEENFYKAFDAFLHTHINLQKNEVNVQLISKEDKDVTQCIQQEIIDKKIDLVLIGAKGRSKLDLLIMGSVAEGIIERNDYCPMIIVK